MGRTSWCSSFDFGACSCGSIQTAVSRALLRPLDYVRAKLSCFPGTVWPMLQIIRSLTTHSGLRTSSVVIGHKDGGRMRGISSEGEPGAAQPSLGLAAR
ncbi:hypothetical protein HPB50_016224 [Hyalomma asiaticum]|uniref:Uncharacterized protein n=1 Tax=Hyalomma asiaticum TaxID=266040 RepID=A0ACB7TE74_HYAAI|nr:hypothetical protein HPB50_016224 [Hyalomma asiaticum]